jgi:hypothetical protein
MMPRDGVVVLVVGQPGRAVIRSAHDASGAAIEDEFLAAEVTLDNIECDFGGHGWHLRG